MIATGTHQNTPAKTSVIIAPSTSTLSANGSRNAPERVAPCRRARKPSIPSVMQRMIHNAVAGQDDGWSPISISSGIASSSRVIVTPLAGVASADGPNEVSDSVISCRFQVRTERVGHRQRRKGPDRQVRRNGDDAVDLRRRAMRPPCPRLVHEDFDLGADQFVTFRGGDPFL